MESLMSRTTLYDMLSMVVPGFIALLSLVVICFGQVVEPEKYCSRGGMAVIIFVCVFAISYLVGMLVHRLSMLIFDGIIRNNPNYIKTEKKKFEDTLKQRRAKDPAGCEDSTECEGTNEYEGMSIMEEYFEKYYLAVQYPFSALPIIEAQVSFIRSMLVVIPLSCVAVCRNGGILLVPTIWAMAILLILGVVVFFLMLSVQKSIHFRVYEDSYYMDKFKKKWNGNGENNGVRA